ncbi:unnamed protein product [Onchocerca flexuosa]|uniref:Shugoshin_C domain-containing protein n=1 Tax=Onchocerca flexuosa TaxID=387005 RepID=A0A183H0G6_9BILA|nr:unnamed protein product [Onchocerca flexuosa]
MNNVADRCKETVKICDFLERNANSLLANMQQHHGMVQHLNGSFVDCAQNLKYFGDVNENSSASGILILQEELNKSDNFPFRNDTFNSILSLSGQNVSNSNAIISKPVMHYMDINEDLSISRLQSVNASENLAVVFGGKDRSNTMKLSQSTNSSNPYTEYILQKNAHSSTVIDRNSTCSTAMQIKKDKFNLQQVGSKRRPKVPRNMKSSRNIFKMESNMHAIFNQRAHSLSRSPPHKNSRPGTN